MACLAKRFPRTNRLYLAEGGKKEEIKVRKFGNSVRILRE